MIMKKLLMCQFQRCLYVKFTSNLVEPLTNAFGKLLARLDKRVLYDDQPLAISPHTRRPKGNYQY